MGKTWYMRGKKAPKGNSRRLGQRNRKRDDSPGELADFPSGKLQFMVCQCRQKVEYLSYDDALEAKKRLEVKFAVEYSPYECPLCGKWHLTTHPWSKN